VTESVAGAKTVVSGIRLDIYFQIPTGLVSLQNTIVKITPTRILDNNSQFKNEKRLFPRENASLIA
jgi:hypothetical protein